MRSVDCKRNRGKDSRRLGISDLHSDDTDVIGEGLALRVFADVVENPVKKFFRRERERSQSLQPFRLKHRRSLLIQRRCLSVQLLAPVR